MMSDGSVCLSVARDVRPRSLEPICKAEILVPSACGRTVT